jgi:hypothetical protein
MLGYARLGQHGIAERGVLKYVGHVAVLRRKDEARAAAELVQIFFGGLVSNPSRHLNLASRITYAPRGWGWTRGRAYGSASQQRGDIR